MLSNLADRRNITPWTLGSLTGFCLCMTANIRANYKVQISAINADTSQLKKCFNTRAHIMFLRSWTLCDLNLVLLNCVFLFFIQMKLELAMQLPSSTFTAFKYFCINHRDQRVFSIWNHHKCLRIRMLWVYGHYKYVYPYSAWTMCLFIEISQIIFLMSWASITNKLIIVNPFTAGAAYIGVFIYY